MKFENWLLLIARQGVKINGKFVGLMMLSSLSKNCV